MKGNLISYEVKCGQEAKNIEESAEVDGKKFALDKNGADKIP